MSLEMGEGRSHQEMLRFHREIDLFNWQFGGEKMRYSFLHRSGIPAPRARRAQRAAPDAGGDPRAPRSAPSPSRAAWAAWRWRITCARRPVNGMIILHHGRIVYEAYPHAPLRQAQP